jgi:hypothetical protein
VRDRRAVPRDAIPFVARHPDRVREHRALSHQAVPLVHVKVVLGVREGAQRGANLVTVLGNVRVDEQLVPPGHRAGRGEQVR